MNATTYQFVEAKGAARARVRPLKPKGRYRPSVGLILLATAAQIIAMAAVLAAVGSLVF